MGRERGREKNGRVQHALRQKLLTGEAKRSLWCGEKKPRKERSAMKRERRNKLVGGQGSNVPPTDSISHCRMPGGSAENQLARKRGIGKKWDPVTSLRTNKSGKKKDLLASGKFIRPGVVSLGVKRSPFDKGTNHHHIKNSSGEKGNGLP